MSSLEVVMFYKNAITMAIRNIRNLLNLIWKATNNRKNVKTKEKIFIKSTKKQKILKLI